MPQNRLRLFLAFVLASTFTAASAFGAEPKAAAQDGAVDASLPTAPQPGSAEVPVVSVSVGFTYLQTDLTGISGMSPSYVLGWYGIPEYHVTKHISVIADFTNFYNFHAHHPENIHGFTGGPLYALTPKAHITPYVFAEGGAVRDSSAGAINWYPAAVGGLGLNFKLSHAVAFQVIPGEYVATQLPNGNFQSNYNAKAGFVFTSFRPKRAADRSRPGKMDR